MSQLQVHLGRYDGQVIAALLIAERLQRDGGRWVIEAPFGEAEDFAIYFETPEPLVESYLLERARSLMLAIGDLDNRVQEACVADCAKSDLHPRNFEGALAYVSIFGDVAHLHYYGTGVNTEWNELAQLQAGTWTYGGVIPPK